MPLVTLTVVRPTSNEVKTQILAAVHRALVAIGVPEADRFQRVFELDADDFRFDASYPDLASPRSSKFVLIEILFSVGRSVKVKRKLIDAVINDLKSAPGLDPEHVMIVFKETAWENWSFGGGRVIHA
jgi:phenylpyruvate tautomerase PptA (4-oxalocrotonate tautomerase family)